jgi:AraC family transcriptional regulator
MGCFGIILEGDYMEGVRKEEYLCGPRTVLFRPPLVEHRSAKGKTGARVLFLEVSNEWLNHIQEYGSIPDRPAVYNFGRFQALAESLDRHWCTGGRTATLAIEGLLYEVAAEILQQGPEDSGRRPQWLSRLVELLHETFNEPVRMSVIAAEVGYHPVYVARVFRHHFGMGVSDYVRKLRVDYARKQLACGDVSLVDIGLCAGFPSHAYFATAFKRETGTTPSQYRRIATKRSRNSTSGV